MKKLGLHEIRKEFLDFFEEKNHLIHDSYSLVPHNDDSMLLIGAGMAPLKKYFTGELVPPRKRMSTCQKCMRTGDLENVGKTARHATFFEMLGNFSFGDYFKREAIEWAWEFMTERLEIPEEVLWVSVYEEDDEAFKIWEEEIGLPKDRIVRLGKEDNFWELEVGPSGPCSEIHVDRGPEYGCGDPNCKPGCECDRFMEVWNLVFTQYDKDEKGVYHPLAHPNIDTGMGLERIATILEGVDNIFEIEAVQDIIHSIEKVSGYEYGNDSSKDESVRVITDHARASTFMVSDAVVPSNEGRGYVLRRLIRRAARHGRLLGINEPFLTKISDKVIDSWKVSYPELETNRDRIKQVIAQEEKKFAETIDQGMDILEDLVKELEAKKEDVLSGKDAFRLYDTFGFPVDLVIEILAEKNIKVDRAGFDEEMEAQRERARSAQNSSNIGWSSKSNDLEIDGDETEFLGYKSLTGKGKVIGLLKENDHVDRLETGDQGLIILDKTPFYGASGGQNGDRGLIDGQGFSFQVTNTIKTKTGIIIHIGNVLEGNISIEDEVEASVNNERRLSIARNHSATHLLNAALRNVLGDHVVQAGSEVEEKSFRFDFTHFEAIDKETLDEIENLVNDYIYSETKAEVYELPIEKAYDEGAIGIFEDSYKDMVRIVNFPNISKELCGGTHVEKTSDIGIFKILSESGIASGTRRIEATTGKNVYEMMKDQDRFVEEIQTSLKANKDNIINKINSLLDENKELEKSLHEFKKDQLRSEIDLLLENAKEVNGVKILSARIDNQEVEDLRNLADELRDKLVDAVVVLGTANENKVNFVATVSDSVIKKGPKAGDIIRKVASITGGGGGGRPNMATAGGKDKSKLDEALDSVYDIVKENL